MKRFDTKLIPLLIFVLCFPKTLLGQDIDYGKLADEVFEKPDLEAIEILKDAILLNEKKGLVSRYYLRKGWYQEQKQIRDDFYNKVKKELAAYARKSPNNSALADEVDDLNSRIRSKKRQYNTTSALAELSYTNHLMASGLGNASNAERHYAEYVRLKNVAEEYGQEWDWLVDESNERIDELNDRLRSFKSSYSSNVDRINQRLKSFDEKITQLGKDVEEVKVELFQLYENNVDSYRDRKRKAEEEAREAEKAARKEQHKKNALSFLDEVDFDSDTDAGPTDQEIEKVLASANQVRYDWAAHNGLIPIGHNGLYGYVAADGEVKIDPQFETASLFDEGMAAVKKYGKWGFVNVEGTAVVLLLYEEARSFSEGLAAAKKNGKWGFVNQRNEEVIPFIYGEAFSFTNGKASVTLGENYFSIDRQGNKVGDD